MLAAEERAELPGVMLDVAEVVEVGFESGDGEPGEAAGAGEGDFRFACDDLPGFGPSGTEVLRQRILVIGMIGGDLGEGWPRLAAEEIIVFAMKGRWMERGFP